MRAEHVSPQISFGMGQKGRVVRNLRNAIKDEYLNMKNVRIGTLESDGVFFQTAAFLKETAKEVEGKAKPNRLLKSFNRLSNLYQRQLEVRSNHYSMEALKKMCVIDLKKGVY